MAVVTGEMIDRWRSHPIVKRAIAQAEPPTAKMIAQHLICILNELETRFPGIPFDQILEAPTVMSKQELVGTLRRAGVCERNIDMIVGRTELADRWRPIDNELFAAIEQCSSHADVLRLGMSAEQAHQMMRMLTPFTVNDERILTLLFTGISQRDVARRLGCDTRTVKIAYLKHRYQLWRKAR